MPHLPEDFEIHTERCRLRQQSEADFPFVLEATRTPGFNEGMPWDPPETDEELTAPLERARDLWRSGVSYNFTIDRKDEGRFLGRISIRKTDEADVWDIGFWVLPSEQGNGYITETAKAILEVGFDRLGAQAIQATHATWNVRSGRVLAAIGMKPDGYVEKGFQKRGEWVPEFRLRITRTDWDATR